ncbi:hypothetical protein M413DRAFT_388391 [Hebeloma cylindrosporum]|uniref:Cytochrome P450 n=1 Tax=Hebeloma cylindrosporum TaxID=76867 RepID=A0A0C2Y1N9_HEBCY|nr:hypothetical protein M413DRAFT_388391 [Hebeloma cylindrosporum h7]
MVRAILHDPAVCPEPLEYEPERYLKDSQLDPNATDPDCAACGFGRRICPGRHLSDNSLYAIVSSILAVCDITPPLDDDGGPVNVVTTGISSYPVPFKCIIKPRGPMAEALIQNCNVPDV